MTNLQVVLVERNDQTAVLTINRPQALNALNAAVFETLVNVLDELEEQKEIKTLILTGAGDKAFVAGADIKEFSSFSMEQAAHMAQTNQARIFDRIECFKKPIIAAINGYALGGGLELALASHLRIASDQAKLGLPETALGLIPGYGGTQRLTQTVGKAMAAQMIFSAEAITAEKAKDIGLVNEVVPAAKLMERALAIAESFNKNSSQALSLAIEAINEAGTPTGYQKEITNFGKAFGNTDFNEGVTAFMEKRKPEFK